MVFIINQLLTQLYLFVAAKLVNSVADKIFEALDVLLIRITNNMDSYFYKLKLLSIFGIDIVFRMGVYTIIIREQLPYGKT